MSVPKYMYRKWEHGDMVYTNLPCPGCEGRIVVDPRTGIVIDKQHHLVEYEDGLEMCSDCGYDNRTSHNI